jgi:DNA-binding CsgD family transcriptional regulator
MPPPDQRSLKGLASFKLTPREAEVLSWISEGKTNQEIGVIVAQVPALFANTSSTF